LPSAYCLGFANGIGVRRAGGQGRAVPARPGAEIELTERGTIKDPLN